MSCPVPGSGRAYALLALLGHGPLPLLLLRFWLAIFLHNTFKYHSNGKSYFTRRWRSRVAISFIHTLSDS